MRASIVLAGLLLLASAPAFAQHIFIDTNNDGVATANDKLGGSATTISIWLQTDANRNGSKPLALRMDSTPMSVFSYDVLLHAAGGTVEWGPYVNEQQSMDMQVGDFRSDSDFYVAYSGLTDLPPGTYKLGTMTIKVKSGTPTIGFASTGPPGCYWAHTAFGSLNPGKAECPNTIMYTENGGDLADPHKRGTWTDADGISAATVAFSGPAIHFGVDVSPNPMNPATTFTVSTTRLGFLKLRLFDVQGRVIRTLVDRPAVPAGVLSVRLDGEGRKPLASGVYFYRVEAGEGRIDGRIVVMK